MAGPAKDTSTDWFRGWRRRLMATGTGLAQPKTGAPVSARTTGTTIDPKGSMCLIGLRVSRPARLAVSSPHQRATTPWLTSWSITAGMNTSEEDQRLLVQHVVAEGEHDDPDRDRGDDDVGWQTLVGLERAPPRSGGQRRTEAQSMQRAVAGWASRRAGEIGLPQRSQMP